jgi:protein CpxP
MKKSIIPVAAMVAIAFGSIAAQADDNRPYRDGKPGMNNAKKQDHFQRMAERLDLSDEQQARARAIFDNSRKKMKHLHEERRELARALMELDPSARDYDRQVRAIARKKADLTEKSTIERAASRKQFHMLLTEEQRAKAREMRKQFRERMERKRDGNWKDRKGERRDGGWNERDRPSERQDRGRPM